MDEEKVRHITEKILKNGGVLSLVYFDVHAKSEEVVKSTLVDLIARLLKEPGVVYAVGEIKETIESDGTFSTSSEVKVLTGDFASLSRLSARYSPIAVEILEPHEVRLTLGEAQNLLLSISETSQEFADYVVKKVLKGKDLEELNRKLAARSALGKKLLEGGSHEARP
ncbi:MAG: hypothetical protein NT157_02430 [Candidatus Micrarchaeota archaeon]|nr:hypothetical protein [Candidatus Micrarchaeota archaeon]